MTTHIDVFIIEDSPGDVYLVKTLLQQSADNHFTINHQNSLKAGIAYLQQHPVDIVLLDLILPDSSGIDTFLTLNKYFPAIPTIIITSSNDDDTAVKALQAGAQDYLVKSVIANDMLGRVIIHSIQRQRLLLDLTKSIQQLEKMDRIKTRFVHDISHELRNPINSLSLYLELLELGKAAKRPTYINALKTQTQRLQLLIEDILNLSRLEMSRDELKFDEVNVNLLLSQVIRLQRERIQQNGIKIIFEPDDNLVNIQGDYQHLLQATTNLIENAINYSPQGTVTIQTIYKPADGSFQLIVTDTGIGIHEEDIPYIFDRFFRGNNKLVQETAGTGLGLLLVKEIVELHNGRIQVTSQLNKGSQFTITLPLKQHPITPQSEPVALHAD